MQIRLYFQRNTFLIEGLGPRTDSRPAAIDDLFKLATDDFLELATLTDDRFVTDVRDGANELLLSHRCQRSAKNNLYLDFDM